MQRAFRSASLLALVLLLVWAAAAQRRGSPAYSLTGSVLGPDGKAVPLARVFLQASDARNPRSTQTDAAGHFHFNVRPGLYDLRAQAQGRWSEWGRNVIVRPGQQTHVTLHLLVKKRPS